MDGTTVLASSTLCFPKLAVVRDPDPSWQLPRKRGEAGVFCEALGSQSNQPQFLERAAGMVMFMDSRTS